MGLSPFEVRSLLHCILVGQEVTVNQEGRRFLEFRDRFKQCEY